MISRLQFPGCVRLISTWIHALDGSISSVYKTANSILQQNQSGGRWLQCHWTSAVASALSNRQNCACARKTLQKQRGRTHGAGCVRQWFRVAVGDCSVTERRRWRPPYQTGKTVHVHANHYKHNEDGRTAPGVCGNGSVPLSHSGNVVTRIGTHTHIQQNLW